MLSKIKAFYNNKDIPKTRTHLMLYLGLLPVDYNKLKGKYPRLIEWCEEQNKAWVLNKAMEDKAFVAGYYNANYTDGDNTIDVNISVYNTEN